MIHRQIDNVHNKDDNVDDEYDEVESTAESDASFAETSVTIPGGAQQRTQDNTDDDFKDLDYATIRA